jgi:hypothetical protein
MIDFPRSLFTRKSQPWYPHRYHRYHGGFVGTPGQAYHVRFTLEAACTVEHHASGATAELFLGAPCRTEYTIASRNLFQVPSGEYRMAFSRTAKLHLAKGPSTEPEPVSTEPLGTGYQDHTIDIRAFAHATRHTDATAVVEATLRHDLLNAQSRYVRDGFTVTVEYPVNLINLNEDDAEFQVCTGPVLLPDLATWDGRQPARVFLAHAAFSAFDHVEFILRRQVEAAPEERRWLDRPRGRDRFELIDPAVAPPGQPLRRPRPYAFNETWELAAENAILAAANDAPRR